MILPSINYTDFGGEAKSLYEYWEDESLSCGTITPSVAYPEYRKLIVKLALRKKSSGKELISIGCGNGFTELELRNAGFAVTATDKNQVALKYARQRSVETARLDIIKDKGLFTARFDVVYCDGVMGHLWSPQFGFNDFFLSISQLVKPNGTVVLSNDLADPGEKFNCIVKVDKDARFFRGSREYTLDLILKFPNLDLVEESLFPYFRPNRRLRIRQVVMLRARYLL